MFIGGDGINLYAYCGNNTVVYYDPSGYAKRVFPPSKTQTINDVKGKNKANFIVDAEGTVIPMNNSYKSFNELKKDLGKAPKGEAKHHIVEQNPTNKSQFMPEMIHNKQNIIDLNDAPKEVHQQITGFFNSKPKYFNGQKVREYVSSMSFNEQFKFGMDQLKDYGDVIWETDKGWVFKPFE